MDLLLDVNIVVDICVKREPFHVESHKAVAQCIANGDKIWLYCGSVQTLEYVTQAALTERWRKQNRIAGRKEVAHVARLLLKEFSRSAQWLAALAEEGPVFDDDDPEDAQLIKSLERFPDGAMRLLTRDILLCQRYPQQSISPAAYLSLQQQKSALPFIDLAAQQQAIRGTLEKNIHRVLLHGQYIMGPEVRMLEERLQAYTEAKHCITVASGTEALLISLMALGIGPGDEVITTPFTFVATAEMIVLLGAKPVFVDIEADTCNIDARLIEAAITPRTKAIMPVSLYGQPADMDEINAIAARHGNIPVIEDAAQSFGATYKGKKSCNLSSIGCTSFFPSKPLGCYGDGGAIFTHDDALAQAMREIRVHGQEKRYYHTRIGVGGRMDTLQCAIVLAKLERFKHEIEQRLLIGQRYNQLFDDAGISRVQQRPDRTSVFAQYTIFTKDRVTMQNHLKEVGIPTAVHYPVPLNEQAAYQHLCCADCTPVAKGIAQQVMSLPMGAYLSDASLQKVFTSVLE